MRRLIPIAVALLAGGACGFWGFGRDWSAVRKAGDDIVVAVDCIAPNPADGSVVQAELHQPVEFIYELRNLRKVPLTKLKTNITCDCTITHTLPPEILPGGTCRVGFTLKPTTIGVIKTSIAITAEGFPNPLVVLTPIMSVPFTAPILNYGPDSPTLPFFRGENATRAIQFEALERKKEGPWITGIDVAPNGVVELTPDAVLERPYADTDLCLRTYRFLVSARDVPVGTHDIVIMPTTSAAGAEPLAPIRAQIRVTSRLALAPDEARISFTSDEPTKTRLSAVDLYGTGTIEVADFDHELLDVRRLETQGSRTHTFEIEAKSAPMTPIVTRVKFAVDGETERELIVHLRPIPAESSTPIPIRPKATPE